MEIDQFISCLKGSCVLLFCSGIVVFYGPPVFAWCGFCVVLQTHFLPPSPSVTKLPLCWTFSFPKLSFPTHQLWKMSKFSLLLDICIIHLPACVHADFSFSTPWTGARRLLPGVSPTPLPSTNYNCIFTLCMFLQMCMKMCVFLMRLGAGNITIYFNTEPRVLTKYLCDALIF